MAEQRIQKVLADQGICSRREAERLIAAGKVILSPWVTRWTPTMTRS